ncbi:MAG: hypothetical protein U0992_02245 [Planctomycetaceae bacterium]
MRANVLSIPALRDLKAGILKFQQEAQGGLEAAQMELHKLIAWIEQDRPAYWNSQVRRAFDQVAATRAALMSCQMRTVGGHRPACIEEKKAHQKAKLRLEHCHEQLKRVQQWAVKLQREVDEFRARVAAARHLVEHGLPQSLAMLDRSIDALEAYAEVPQPLAQGTADAQTESG